MHMWFQAQLEQKNLEWYLQEHGAIVTRDKLITIAKIESASLNRLHVI